MNTNYFLNRARVNYLIWKGKVGYGPDPDGLQCGSKHNGQCSSTPYSS